MQHEEQEQIMLMQWARLQEMVYPELKWMFHIPNGGQRNKAVAAKLKAAGVKPGVPDLCLPVQRGGYAGLYIELKYGKNRATDKQHEWLEHLSNEGYKTAVCHGFESARDLILEYLRGKKRE